MPAMWRVRVTVTVTALLLILLFSTAAAAAAASSSSSAPPALPTCAASDADDACHTARAEQIRSMMPYRRLGRSGLLVSRLSFGAWITFGAAGGVDAAKAATLMRECLDHGVNFFDNAEAYRDGEAEVVMGSALKILDVPRHHIVVSTKIFFGTSRAGGRWVPNDKGLSRKHVVEGLRNSLSRLQLEYVDVVFAHRPDMHTPMEEIVRAFTHVIDRGWAFYWCTSEWSAEQIRHAVLVAERLQLIAPVCEQPQYNMLERRRFEIEYKPVFRDYGYGTTIWSALSSGVLTGKYNKGIPTDSRLANTARGRRLLADFKNKTRHLGLGWDDILGRVRALAPIAEEAGCTMAQLAIAWALKNEDVTTVILGATKISQLRDNFGAIACAKRLDAAAMDKIAGVLDNAPADVRDWNPTPAAHR